MRPPSSILISRKQSVPPTQDAHSQTETAPTTSSGCRHLPMSTANSTISNGRMEGKEAATYTHNQSWTCLRNHLIHSTADRLECTNSGQRKLLNTMAKIGRVPHSHGLQLLQAWENLGSKSSRNQRTARAAMGGRRHPLHYTDTVQGCKPILLWTYLKRISSRTQPFDLVHLRLSLATMGISASLRAAAKSSKPSSAANLPTSSIC